MFWSYGEDLTLDMNSSESPLSNSNSCVNLIVAESNPEY